jgi:hypothetical protein
VLLCYTEYRTLRENLYSIMVDKFCEYLLGMRKYRTLGENLVAILCQCL